MLGLKKGICYHVWPLGFLSQRTQCLLLFPPTAATYLDNPDVLGRGTGGIRALELRVLVKAGTRTEGRQELAGDRSGKARLIRK